MLRSHRWAKRCLKEFARTHTGKQALYGIIQGGIYHDLREKGVDFVNNQPFFGMAIGGSLGGTKKDMHEIVSFTRSLMSNDRPIHLLGIGGVRDIFHGVRQGIDTFDCVHPTRLGRHGGALVTAAHWSEEDVTSGDIGIMTESMIRKKDKRLNRELDRIGSLRSRASGLVTSIAALDADRANPSVIDIMLILAPLSRIATTIR
jgi:queuine tRNA-ribosyltransferase